jgi:hypothetical protein
MKAISIITEECKKAKQVFDYPVLMRFTENHALGGMIVLFVNPEHSIIMYLPERLKQTFTLGEPFKVRINSSNILEIFNGSLTFSNLFEPPKINRVLDHTGHTENPCNEFPFTSTFDSIFGMPIKKEDNSKNMKEPYLTSTVAPPTTYTESFITKEMIEDMMERDRKKKEDGDQQNAFSKFKPTNPLMNQSVSRPAPWRDHEVNEVKPQESEKIIHLGDPEAIRPLTEEEKLRQMKFKTADF